jgi:hypothetical protein
MCTGGVLPQCACIDGRHSSELLSEVNFELSLPPTPLTAEMIASEIPAAINPYSIDWAMSRGCAGARDRLLS